jgi:hypothetical protein
MPDTITPRQAALWFASKGYPVLPLHSVENGVCTCGVGDCHSPGKHPYAEIVPHGAKDASTNLATVRGWFDEHYWLNYGVCTDQLLVIDVDTRHGGLEAWAEMYHQPTRALPHTWQVKTGSGGRHIFFRNTANTRCGSLDRGVDVKAVGGYVCGPMSKHASGKTYTWLPQSSPLDAPLADPPEWLLVTIKSRTHCGRALSVQEWRSIARTPVLDGERHKVFLQLAGHLIAHGIDAEVARDLMMVWNEARCGPPLGERDVLQMLDNLCERELSKARWL